MKTSTVFSFIVFVCISQSTLIKSIENVGQKKVSANGTVSLECSNQYFDNSSTGTYKWLTLFGKPFVNTTNINIFSNGTLTILKAVRPEVFYCQKINGDKISKHPVYVSIVNPPQIQKISKNQSVKRGSQILFECGASGSLPLTYNLYINDEQVIKNKASGSLNYIFNKTSVVKCVVSNVIGTIKVERKITVTDELPTDPIPKLPLCSKYQSKSCGQFLSQNVGAQYTFQENINTPNYMTKLEKATSLVLQKIDNLLRLLSYDDDTKSVDSHLPGLCADRLKRIVCATTFPACNVEKNKPVDVCRSSCQITLKQFCRPTDVWSLNLLRDIDIGPILKGKSGPVGKLLNHGCGHLQEGGSATKPCNVVDLEPELAKTQEHNFTDKCYNNRGELYRGPVNTSQHDVNCTPWNQLVEPVPWTDAFPSLLKAGASCRNPGGLYSRPFCIPNNPTLKLDFPMVFCKKVMDCKSHAASIKEEVPGLRAWPGNVSVNIAGLEIKLPVYILVIAVVLAFFLILFISIFACRRYKKDSPESLKGVKGYNSRGPGCIAASGPSSATYDMDSEIRNKLTQNQLFHNKSVTEFPKLQRLEYPRNNLIDIRDLGRGAFGEVILAEAPGLSFSLSGSSMDDDEDNPNSMGGGHQDRMENGMLSTTPLLSSSGGEAGQRRKRRQVAVKVLNSQAEGVEISFVMEAQVLVELDHPNIIKLLGICATSKPLCLLLEYMPNGDLNTFLQRYNVENPHCPPLPPGVAETSFINGTVRPGESLGTSPLKKETRAGGGGYLDKYRLTNMAINVAAGMEYLSNNCYVHRDLATRNCLVGELLEVKLSDFSLCRPIKRGVDYVGSDIECVPIRWLPLESIEENRYNLDTDVWSYGVLLWELFSAGEQPYTDMSPEQVIDFLRNGSFLDCPKRCPPEIYEEMRSCWYKDRKHRPTFGTLHKHLLNIRKTWNNN